VVNALCPLASSVRSHGRFCVAKAPRAARSRLPFVAVYRRDSHSVRVSHSRSLSGISSFAPLARIVPRSDDHANASASHGFAVRLRDSPFGRVSRASPCQSTRNRTPAQMATPLPSRSRCSLASLVALLIPRATPPRDETRDGARHDGWSKSGSLGDCCGRSEASRGQYRTVTRSSASAASAETSASNESA